MTVSEPCLLLGEACNCIATLKLVNSGYLANLHWSCFEAVWNYRSLAWSVALIRLRASIFWEMHLSSRTPAILGMYYVERFLYYARSTLPYSTVVEDNGSDSSSVDWHILALFLRCLLPATLHEMFAILALHFRKAIDQRKLLLLRCGDVS